MAAKQLCRSSVRVQHVSSDRAKKQNNRVSSFHSVFLQQCEQQPRGCWMSIYVLVALGWSPSAPTGAYAPTRAHPRAPSPSCAAEMSLEDEVLRRRNLAIISHPDAGKTTLTEKLLLYGGAIQQAGAVKAKGEQRRATSDFMEIEQQR